MDGLLPHGIDAEDVRVVPLGEDRSLFTLEPVVTTRTSEEGEEGGGALLKKTTLEQAPTSTLEQYLVKNAEYIEAFQCGKKVQEVEDELFKAHDRFGAGGGLAESPGETEDDTPTLKMEDLPPENVFAGGKGSQGYSTTRKEGFRFSVELQRLQLPDRARLVTEEAVVKTIMHANNFLRYMAVMR